MRAVVIVKQYRGRFEIHPTAAVGQREHGNTAAGQRIARVTRERQCSGTRLLVFVAADIAILKVAPVGVHLPAEINVTAADERIAGAQIVSVGVAVGVRCRKVLAQTIMRLAVGPAEFETIAADGHLVAQAPIVQTVKALGEQHV